MSCSVSICCRTAVYSSVIVPRGMRRGCGRSCRGASGARTRSGPAHTQPEGAPRLLPAQGHAVGDPHAAAAAGGVPALAVPATAAAAVAGLEAARAAAPRAAAA